MKVYKHVFILCGIMFGVNVNMTSSEIYSSSMKVQRMVLEQGKLLGDLKNYIDFQYRRLKEFSSFYQDEIHKVRARVTSQSTREELRHPNGVYSAIKHFAQTYETVLGENLESFQKYKSPDNFLAESKDVAGARLALLRLQSVYKLQAVDMASGDYLGYSGPPLKPGDFYGIAQTAFTESYLDQSLSWLNLSLELYDETLPAWDRPSMAQIKSLMGRVYLYKGDFPKAEQLYAETSELDSENGDVIALRDDLKARPRVDTPEEKPEFRNFSRLCRLKNGVHLPSSRDARLVCRFKAGRLLPYNRFREEILSISPFVSLIYDVITDKENRFITDQVKNKLERGKIADSIISDEVRTSDLAWLWDKDSKRVSEISKRVEAITGLDVKQREHGPDSAEAFQVVNYGLGGHYDVHMDPFDEDEPSRNPELKDSGERIATFLIYLTDVERGGATVFTRANIAVAPKKNMALLWYNFTPKLARDELTHHAGCPVLIGHKWVINKWIWTYGNTFRRRCGLNPDSTQLDIEQLMGVS